MKNLIKISLLSLVATMAAQTAVRAQATITSGGDAINTGASGATTYGTSGYSYFDTSTANQKNGTFSGTQFGAGTTIASLPSYVSTITGAAVSPDSAAGYGYSTITIPGTGNVEAGYTLEDGPINTENNVLNISLKGTVPLNFTLGVLTNISTNENTYPEDLTLTDDYGGSFQLNTVGTQGTRANGGNDYYFFNVSGAQAGDVLTLSGLETTNDGGSTRSFVAVSGVTFDPESSTAVPEPSTWALMVAGMSILVVAVRRRASNLA